jgi:hypothetical protein
LLPTQGKVKFCSPLHSTDTLELVSKSMVVAPRLGYRSGCTHVPLLKTGLHAFRIMMPSFNVMELWIDES